MGLRSLCEAAQCLSLSTNNNRYCQGTKKQKLIFDISIGVDFVQPCILSSHKKI